MHEEARYAFPLADKNNSFAANLLHKANPFCDNQFARSPSVI